MTRTLPVSLLYSEGPIARAYLHALLASGFKPQRVIHLISANDVATGEPAGRVLSPSLRQKYCAWLQDVRMNYWPRRIKKTMPGLFREMMDRLNDSLDLPRSIFEAITGSNPLSASGLTVLPLILKGFNDPGLRDLLEECSPGRFIFTGGGIVPADLFDIEGLKLLHVHPGLLPHVRGSDGLLWSTLVRGRPGASSLYLSREIDLGSVIFAREYEPISFYRPGTMGDEDVLYRAVYAFYDPVLRARHLIDSLRGVEDWTQLPVEEQEEKAGLTYRFMNKNLRRRALKQIFDRTAR